MSVYRTLTASLNSSKYNITNSTILLLKSMENKLANESTTFTASRWFAKATLIHYNTKIIIEYIDSLKIQLKNESGLTIVDKHESFRESDINAVSQLFDKKNKGEELKERLIKFEQSLMSIDQELNAVFKNTIALTIGLSDPSEQTNKSFTQIFFDRIPSVAALAVLSKFQNDVKIIENETIIFCDNKIPS